MGRKILMGIFSVLLCSGSAGAGFPADPAVVSDSVLSFTMKNIDGIDIPLSSFKGKIVLIVNVASRCGYTPQYEGLEALYRKYKDSGFVVLGFPANNFLFQEPGTDTEIKAFCTTTYGVTFPMFSKISVRGKDQHPLYRYLTSGGGNEELAGDVKWNFTKYLVGRNGTIIGKFGSSVKPLSDDMVNAIESQLRKN